MIEDNEQVTAFAGSVRRELVRKSCIERPPNDTAGV